MVKDPLLMESSGNIIKDIASKTSNLQILENLGDLFNKQGQTTAAVELYERLLKQAPDS